MSIFLRGATAYEWQIGRLYGRFPYWTYLRVGCWPTIGWDSDPEYPYEDEDE